MPGPYLSNPPSQFPSGPYPGSPTAGPPDAYYSLPPSQFPNQQAPPHGLTSSGELCLKDYMWKFVVERGSALAAKDSNGKSDPYVIVELVTAENKNGEWVNIKTFQKVKSSVIHKTLDPTWSFQAYLLNAEQLWSKFNGVKISCFDEDLVGADDFMGEGYLWLDLDIPAPPESKEIQLHLKQRPKKKN